jgi:hypothetical protein
VEVLCSITMYSHNVHAHKGGFKAMSYNLRTKVPPSYHNHRPDNLCIRLETFEIFCLNCTQFKQRMREREREREGEGGVRTDCPGQVDPTLRLHWEIQSLPATGIVYHLDRKFQKILILSHNPNNILLHGNVYIASHLKQESLLVRSNQSSLTVCQ